ncbi:putative multidrug transporter [Aureobasidium sp. EXF-10727]|nr:putative multidrug transporter [Aureobasidium sp. EXF-10727]
MSTNRGSTSISGDKDEKDFGKDRPSSGQTSDGGKQNDHPSNEHGDIEVVDWNGRDDPANPSILTGLPAGSYSAANDQMSSLWHVQNEPFPNLTFATVSWNLGAALFPLLFVPLTENLGRMPGYLYVEATISHSAGCLPIFWLLLKETRGDVILARRAKKLRKEGRNAYAKSELNKDNVFEMLKVSFKRPTKMLLTEYTVASFTLWVSFAWGLLFLFQSSITQTFSTNYGFSVFQTSLIQLSLSAGATIATIVNPIQDQLYLRSARRNKDSPGKPIPEARLYFSIPGSLIFTAGLFVYGWTSYTFVPWIAPAIGIAMVGFGIYSIYQAVVNYFTDAYSKYSASALSAASFGRNLFGAFLPLASPQLYSNLGYQWASTLLGLVALVLSLAPVFLLVKGSAIRARSPFMAESAYDDEDAEERRNGSVAKPAGRAGGNPGPHGQAVPATV